MCGICGIVGNDRDIRNDEPLIGAMCDVIVHRGPDEDGYFFDASVALGMRRLKIIDLSTGSQPIYNENKSVVVIFNGEIYNFKELKKELIEIGHRFYTNSDTEVIAHLYEDFGEDFLKYLNGMFGLAVWDRKKRTLIIARDRMGEKPLYYTSINGSLIFGSEIKSLLCHPQVNNEMEPEGIYHYFTFKSPPGSLTSYKNIIKLRPAEFLVWKNGAVKKDFYWNLNLKTREKISEHELKERINDEVTRAVKMRLISDVPLGAFLSGGIDSSIMVATMAQVSDFPVKTFSIGLDNESESELPYARAVADRYGTEHHELIARPEALDLIEHLIWHFDEPFGDSSAIPTFLVSQLTRQYVTVAISGDGGDELFGGYERYRRILKRRSVEIIPITLRTQLSKFIGDQLPFGFRGKRFLQTLKYNNYEAFVVGAKAVLKKYLFSEEFLNQLKNVNSTDIAARYKLKDQKLLNQCMYYDLNLYLPDDIMTKVDRMSMANSLETRAPFLDHQLVEFALTIPPEMKVSKDATKIILKKAFREHLPEKVFFHKKTGFSIPLAEWFRNELKALVLETLSTERIRNVGILNDLFIQKIISQHMSGYRNHHHLIWLILMFQLWYENWIDKTHSNIEKAIKIRSKQVINDTR